MYLVDTNVWLERLLSQERSDEVGQFLAHVPGHELPNQALASMGHSTP